MITEGTSIFLLQVWNVETLSRVCYIPLSKTSMSIRTLTFSELEEDFAFLSVVEESKASTIFVFRNVETSSAFLYASYSYDREVFLATFRRRQFNSLVTVDSANLVLWDVEEDGCCLPICGCGRRRKKGILKLRQRIGEQTIDLLLGSV